MKNYSFDRYPYLQHCSTPPEEKPKLTFEQWYHKTFNNLDDEMFDYCKQAWDAAQENK